MPTLHLGVLDVTYSDSEGATTTGEVATYLEDRYYIMHLFSEMNSEFIGDELARSMIGAIETSKSTGRALAIDFQGAMSKIEAKFRGALDSGEIHAALPMLRVSTKTLMSSTRKKDMQTNQLRAAFVDTGLYQNSFRAWVTGA